MAGDPAEVVSEALRQVGLSKIIDEFDVAELLKLHKGGYTTPTRIKAAKQAGLEKSGLLPALVDLLLDTLSQQGEFNVISGNFWPSLIEGELGLRKLVGHA